MASARTCIRRHPALRHFRRADVQRKRLGRYQVQWKQKKKKKLRNRGRGMVNEPLSSSLTFCGPEQKHLSLTPSNRYVTEEIAVTRRSICLHLLSYVCEISCHRLTRDLLNFYLSALVCYSAGAGTRPKPATDFGFRSSDESESNHRYYAARDFLVSLFLFFFRSRRYFVSLNDRDDLRAFDLPHTYLSCRAERRRSAFQG